MTFLTKREGHQWPNQLEEIAPPSHGEEHTERTQRNPIEKVLGGYIQSFFQLTVQFSLEKKRVNVLKFVQN